MRAFETADESLMSQKLLKCPKVFHKQMTTTDYSEQVTTHR